MLCINIPVLTPTMELLQYTLINSKLTQAKKHKYIRNIFMFLRGGLRGRVIPGSIPNPEVKPPIADNTYPVWIGNVGRCLFEFLSFSYFFFFLYGFLFLLTYNATSFYIYYHIYYTSLYYTFG